MSGMARMNGIPYGKDEPLVFYGKDGVVQTPVANRTLKVANAKQPSMSVQEARAAAQSKKVSKGK